MESASSLKVSRFVAADPRIVALNPMASDGVGPSHSCERLVSSMHQNGQNISLFVTRNTVSSDQSEIRPAIPPFLNYVPYRVVEDSATLRAEKNFKSTVQVGDIAWLWPFASLSVHEDMARRGIPIILEAINTRMRVAKDVLDAAYDAFGAEAGHGITDARIAIEEAKWDLAAGIFTPSLGTERAASGTRLETALLSCSYGTDVTPAVDRPKRATGERVNFIFVGYGSVRKGTHLLLDVWRDMPANYHLTLVGNLETCLQERYADLLQSDRVTHTGFVRNISDHLAQADIFVLPSLEEGDALVTYEAANAGLPLAVSEIGGGRLASKTNCAQIFDPYQPDEIRRALQELGEDAELRHHLGKLARDAVKEFDWSTVAKARCEAIDAFISA